MPTATSIPAAQRGDLRLVGAPAVQGVYAHRADLARVGPRSLATWTASSRVGTTTRACGPRKAAVAGASRHVLQQRDAERERLASAGASLADDVVPAQPDGQGQALDGEGRGDPSDLQGRTDLLIHAKVTERLTSRPENRWPGYRRPGGSATDEVSVVVS